MNETQFISLIGTLLYGLLSSVIGILVGIIIERERENKRK